MCAIKKQLIELHPKYVLFQCRTTAWDGCRGHVDFCLLKNGCQSVNPSKAADITVRGLKSGNKYASLDEH